MVLTDREQRFNELFERLIDAMTENDRTDKKRIEDILGDIAAILRLSKAMTRLCRNKHEEDMGGGERLCSYDLHEEDEVLVYAHRLELSMMSYGTIELYMKRGSEPFDDFEKGKAVLVSKTLLTFLCRNRMKNVIRELALFDDSGFKNNRSFTNYIMETSARGDLGGRAAVHYNLRHFSLVNRQIGRDAGDTVLHRHFIGLEKLIGGRGIVTRLGGDNFLAICGKEQLDDVIAYLSETKVVYNDDGDSVFITTSTGVFVFPDVFVIKDPGEVLNNVIIAAKAAQNGGKEHVVFFSDRLIEGREKAMTVQQRFPQALANGEFQVYYQPKVNVFTGKIVGAEALCRWIRDGQVVPPIDFIPMLEETNDICKLDMYMLGCVCADIKRWLSEGRDAVRISVNLSRKNMMNADLLERIMAIINESGIPHELIEIELTETTTDVEFKDLKRVVGGLQQQGVCATVDDFGIGYSSLNLIKAIPWNVLKIDRSFLPTEGDSSSFVMFRHVVSMAMELGLQCIAEGVETTEQREMLKDSGCTTAQGFLYDRPLPKEEFEKRMEAKKYSI